MMATNDIGEAFVIGGDQMAAEDLAALRQLLSRATGLSNQSNGNGNVTPEAVAALGALASLARQYQAAADNPSGTTTVNENIYGNTAGQPMASETSIGGTPAPTDLRGTSPYVPAQGGTEAGPRQAFSGGTTGATNPAWTVAQTSMGSGQTANYNQNQSNSYAKSLQQQEAAVNYVEQQIRTGNMTTQQGDDFINRIRNGAMMGSIPSGGQNDGQVVARNASSDQSTLGQSIAKGLMSSL